MKHFGDITKLSGYDLPVVDVIAGGSPCQDLSVAGKRAGLSGERSGLFMDQIRIVKEMRQADVLRGRSGQFIRPRYMVWENVPGAFSSGKPKGADFAAVIEEIIKVCEEGASVSVCVPDGGWTKSGCYYAEDGSWSIAWRVHDAQFWGASQYVDGRMLVRGTPQRRKRIALVADFGGLSAPEILFERKGLSRDSEPGGTERQRVTGGVERGTSGTNCGADMYNGSLTGDVAVSLNANTGLSANHAGPSVLSKSSNRTVKAFGISSYESNAMKSSNPHSGCYETDTVGALRARDYKGIGNQYVNEGKVIVNNSPK